MRNIKFILVLSCLGLSWCSYGQNNSSSYGPNDFRQNALFGDSSAAVSYFKSSYSPSFSPRFVLCAGKQLTSYFEKMTGLHVNKQTSISSPQGNFLYERGEVSKINSTIYINNNWNRVSIAWKSKSGRIYDIGDKDIDCDDVVFWFEGIDSALYHRQLFPTVKLPFQVENLGYQLIVNRFNVDCWVEITLKSSEPGEIKSITDQVLNYIDKFNEDSEKHNGKYGYVHNAHSASRDNKIMFYIDIGSAGPMMFKELLPELSKSHAIEKVEIN